MCLSSLERYVADGIAVTKRANKAIAATFFLELPTRHSLNIVLRSSYILIYLVIDLTGLCVCTIRAMRKFDRIWSPRGQSSNARTFITKQSRCLLVPSRSLAATIAMRYKGRQSFKGYKCMPNGTVSGSGISPRPIVRNEIAWDVSSCWKDAVYGLLIERGTMNGPGMINRS